MDSSTGDGSFSHLKRESWAAPPAAGSGGLASLFAEEPKFSSSSPQPVVVACYFLWLMWHINPYQSLPPTIPITTSRLDGQAATFQELDMLFKEMSDRARRADMVNAAKNVCLDTEPQMRCKHRTPAAAWVWSY